VELVVADQHQHAAATATATATAGRPASCASDSRQIEQSVSIVLPIWTKSRLSREPRPARGRLGPSTPSADCVQRWG